MRSIFACNLLEMEIKVVGDVPPERCPRAEPNHLWGAEWSEGKVGEGGRMRGSGPHDIPVTADDTVCGPAGGQHCHLPEH